MGGHAAKERRRQAREAVQPPPVVLLDDAPQKLSSPRPRPGDHHHTSNDRHPSRDLHQHQHHNSKNPDNARDQRHERSKNDRFPRQFHARRGDHTQAHSHSNSTTTTSTSTTTTPPKAKTHPKKPKHLKRKLQQASEDEEKEAIRQKLQAWQDKKVESRETTAPRAKKVPRQKITPRMPTTTALPEKPIRTPPPAASDKASPPLSDPVVEPSASPAARLLADEDVIPSGRTTQPPNQTPPLVVDAVNEPGIDRTQAETPVPLVDASTVAPGTTITTTSSTHGDEKETNMTQMAETSVARSSDGSDPEDDEQGGSDMEENAKRQRGKRRRGRKDTSKKVEVEQGTPASTGPGEISKGDVTTKLVERYCLGRKPVTDFVVGQECKGKVVYMKAFGVFLDIGCHSDAFCHISRLQDTFVEKPEELLNVGDEVTSRIVEVDRRRKRITVSMQSADMMEKELKSIESRKERMQRHAKKSKPLHTRPSVMAVPPSKDASETDKQEERRDPTSTPVASPRMPSSSSNQQEQPSGKRTSVPSTHADLKRERKLARRAARRATNEPGEDGDLSQ